MNKHYGDLVCGSMNSFALIRKSENPQVLSEYLKKNSSKLNSQDLLENYKHVLMSTIKQELKLDMNEDLIEILQKDYMISKDSLNKEVNKESPENLKSTSESDEGNNEKNSFYPKNGPYFRKKNKFSQMNEFSDRKLSNYLENKGYKPWRDDRNKFRPSFKRDLEDTPSLDKAHFKRNRISRLTPNFENKQYVRWNYNSICTSSYGDRFNNHNTFYKKATFPTSGSTVCYPENPESALYHSSSYSSYKRFYEK